MSLLPIKKKPTPKVQPHSAETTVVQLNPRLRQPATHNELIRDMQSHANRHCAAFEDSARLLDYLISKGTIRAHTAKRELGISNLYDVIEILRDQGCEIEHRSLEVVDENGNSYKQDEYTYHETTDDEAEPKVKRGKYYKTVKTMNLILNSYMEYLDGVELKIVLFIFQRTIAFQRPDADISIDHFCHGVFGYEDHQMINNGVGMSERTIKRHLAALIAYGLVIRKKGAPGRWNNYMLNLELSNFELLANKTAYCEAKNKPLDFIKSSATYNRNNQLEKGRILREAAEKIQDV